MFIKCFFLWEKVPKKLVVMVAWAAWPSLAAAAAFLLALALALALALVLALAAALAAVSSSRQLWQWHEP